MGGWAPCKAQWGSHSAKEPAGLEAKAPGGGPGSGFEALGKPAPRLSFPFCTTRDFCKSRHHSECLAGVMGMGASSCANCKVGEGGLRVWPAATAWPWTGLCVCCCDTHTPPDLFSNGTSSASVNAIPCVPASLLFPCQPQGWHCGFQNLITATISRPRQLPLLLPPLLLEDKFL